MAGNIVKWWKHKILGGYKQFTVLQECATDSEELIYPGRAPSACSAPPDLLLTSDREQMLKVKTSSSTGACTGQSKASQQHQQQQQHHQGGGQHHGGGHLQSQSANGHNHSTASQQQQHHKSQKDAFRKCSVKAAAMMAGTAGGSGGGGAGGATNTINTTAATIRSDPDRVRLEEFTCDVSLEDGKKPQPLQFSFTLYDLDGHGKITKDDIAGIVSTIYESIGKSVVVPHYGSKTINVRLTVSPDGKTAATKSASAIKKAIITPRRRGYRSRKLISDEDGSDTSENCPRMLLRHRATATAANNASNAGAAATANNTNQTNQQNHHHHHHHLANGTVSGGSGKVKESNLSKAAALAAAAATAGETRKGNHSTGLSKSSEATSPAVETYHNNLSSAGPRGGLNNAVSVGKQSENVYASISNLKCCNLQQQVASSNNTSQTASHVQSPISIGTGLNQSTASTAALICRECIDGPMVAVSGCHLEQAATLGPLDAVVIPTSAAIANGGRSKRKLVRKTRSSRKVAATTTTKLTVEDFAGRPRARSLSVGNENCYENVIGRVAAAPGECWKSSLCRRELIEIIRESMVKNSLCFQPNRKATESSPKHRHRSHTIASRVGDQVFLNYHPHPALLAANGGSPMAAELGSTQIVSMVGHEANLCGYDSYLHQTICAAGNGVAGHSAGATAATTTAHLAAAAHTTAAVIQPLTTSTPSRLLQQHHHHAKAKRKEHRMALAATTGGPVAGRSSSHPAPVKLSTALLNQQYPNLSAEQKLTRSINQVEQWLDHRSPKVVLSKVKLSDATLQLMATARASQAPSPGRPTLKRSKSKEELIPGNKSLLTGDLLLLENLKVSEDIAEIAVVTPKKVYNKESLIASATKKNIKTHHHQPQDRQRTIAPTMAEKAAAAKGDQVVQLQYGSVPVNADPSECENLIRMSDDGEEELLLPQLAQARQQQQHQHHRQSQSQPQSPQHQQQRYCGAPTATAAASGAHSVSSVSAASTTAVHRYVHEHIHHHYHHFENDPDES